jgi:hypothetical protein
MQPQITIRSEDFRDIWPTQARAILHICAMIQRQCKILHEQTLASSIKVSQDLDGATKNLADMAFNVADTSKATQQQCTRSMKELEYKVISRVDNYIREHGRISEAVLEQIDELRKRERRYMQAREEFLTLPWWRRLWGGNTLPSL